jgi:hypothetical protein
MNSDFWDRFPVIPGFDCLKMKHDIQAKIHEETKNMTQEQRMEYYRAGAKKLRRRGRIEVRDTEPLVVRETRTPYGAKNHRNDKPDHK